MSGKFIVFEGIDGSGKSSSINGVSELLKKDGYKVIVTQEPTNDEIGSIIRNEKVKRISQKSEALLFTADRAVHTEKILEWLNEGFIVLCDRYFASTVAYQSSPLKGEALDKDWLMNLNLPIIRMPDITFLLDLDVKVSLNRVDARNARSKFEDLEYLEHVRNKYLDLSKEFDFVIVDTNNNQEKVLELIIRNIKEIL